MTKRNFGLYFESSRPGTTEPSYPADSRGAEMSAEPNSLSFASRAAFKARQIAQSARNVLDLALLFVLFAILFLSVPIAVGLLVWSAFRSM